MKLSMTFALLLSCGADAAPATAPAGESLGIYVPQSFEARQAVRTLQAFESEGRWAEAARRYHQLADEAGDELVKLDEAHFYNVREYVRERLRFWPESAQERYRQTMGEEAVRALQADETSGRHEDQPPGRPSDHASTRVAEPSELFWVSRIDEPAGLWAKLTVQPSGRPPHDGCPLVAAGTVYVQHGSRLTALDLDSGRPRWKLRLDKPERAEPAPTDRGRGPVTPVVSGGRIYANLSWCEQDREHACWSVLICAEAASGSLRWRAEMASPDLSGAFKPIRYFDGTPLVYRDKVYVIARRGRNLGFEDCWLVCFDAGAGTELWRTMIASGPVSTDDRQWVTRSDPAAAGGDIFIQTNLGAVARVKGETGVVRWLTLDRQKPTPERAEPGEGARVFREGRWHAPSPLWPIAQPARVAWIGDPARPRMLTIPVRSADLVSYDVSRGEEIHRLPRLEWGDYPHTLGLVDGILYAAGTRAAAVDFNENSSLWTAEFRGSGAAPPAGHPCLTRDKLFVPFADRLAWISLDGRATGRLLWSDLDPAEPLDGGHVAAGEGLLVVQAGPRVWCLTGLEAGLVRLRTRAAARPGDRSALLDLARLGLARLESQREGLDAWDAAVTGAAAPPPGDDTAKAMADLTDRAVEILLEAARQAAHRHGEAAAPFLQELLRRAVTIGHDPEHQVICRLVLAEAFSQAAAYTAALELYLEILGAPAWRDVRLPVDATEEPPRRSRWKTQDRAERLARGRLNLLLEQHGQELGLSTTRAADARMEAATRPATAEASRQPRVSPPLAPAYRIKRDGGMLLHPRSDPERAGSLLLLFGCGRLEAIDARTGGARWQAEPVSVGTPVWLACRGPLLVLSTPYQLLGLDRRSGRTVWTVGRPPREAASPAIDPESLTRLEAVALGARYAVGFASDGQGFAVELETGDVLWEQALPGRTGTLCAVNDTHVAYLTGGHPAALEVQVLDVQTGREESRCKLEPHGQLYWCGFTPQGQLLLAASDRLTCLGPLPGTQLWSVDGLRLNRIASLVLGNEHFFLEDAGRLVCRAYADGQTAWDRDLAGLGGSVLQGWLAGDALWLATSTRAVALQPESGEVRASTPWPAGLQPLSARLTGDSILMIAGAGTASEEWLLRACWGGRTPEEGRAVPRCEDLGSYAGLPDAAVRDGAIAIWTGSELAGWTSKQDAGPDE